MERRPRLNMAEFHHVVNRGIERKWLFMTRYFSCSCVLVLLYDTLNKNLLAFMLRSLSNYLTLQFFSYNTIKGKICC
jgi:hypothetical protein